MPNVYVKRSAYALAGSVALVPAPVEDGAENRAIQAVADVINGGDPDYQVIRDGHDRVTKIKCCNVGGSIGDVCSFWTAAKPGSTNGRWDGLKQRY